MAKKYYKCFQFRDHPLLAIILLCFTLLPITLDLILPIFYFSAFAQILPHISAYFYSKYDIFSLSMLKKNVTNLCINSDYLLE